MAQNLETPVAVVTGAGTGIGRETALGLARAGYSVVLVGRRIGVLEETLSSLPEGAQGHCLSTDIGDAKQAWAIAGAAVERFGRLDAVVNNAAIAPLLPIDQTTSDVIEDVYAVNAVGPACTIAAAWAVFRKQHAEGRAGRPCIVNVSTLGTMDPFNGFFAYAASKGALNVMAKSCASEGKEIGVRAFSIAPGAVETEMLRSIFGKDVLPTEKCLSPQRVADEIVACVLGERDQWNGRTIYMSSERGVVVG